MLTNAGTLDRLQWSAAFRLPTEDTIWGISIDYQPVVDSTVRSDLSGRFVMLDQASPAWTQFMTLLPILQERLEPEGLLLDGEHHLLYDEIAAIKINSQNDEIWLELKSGGRSGTYPIVDRHDLTPSQQSLFDNIRGSVERFAWEDFRRRLGVAPTDRPKVLISYRRGHEQFAEAVAYRLGKENLIPLYDRWESLAGDSIPGKIAQWLSESIGCVIIVTSDYQAGIWATVEFEGAITKRAEGRYTVVPVVLEKCPLPELLKPIQHVDCSDRDPQQFEAKMVEVINAIYRVELNHYRR